MVEAAHFRFADITEVIEGVQLRQRCCNIVRKIKMVKISSHFAASHLDTEADWGQYFHR